MVHDVTWHDDETMQKVYSVLRSLGLMNGMSTEIVMRLQNNGILFREYAREPEKTRDDIISDLLKRFPYGRAPYTGKDETLPETYQDKARRIVIEHFNAHRDVTDSRPIEYKDTYVCWFSYTLGNWKALVRTTVSDGKYYEVTYNVDNVETYLDVYVKVVNEAIPDLSARRTS